MQIDWLTVAAQIVNFLVLVWLLQRFLYRPISNAMRRREDRIEERLAEARSARSDAEEEAERLRQERAELAERKEQMLEEARAEADDLRKERAAALRAEMEEKRETWQAQLAQERADFARAVQEQAARELIEITEDVLQDFADADLADRVSRTFVARLENLEEARREKLAQAARDSDEPARVETASPLPAEAKRRLTRAIHDGLSTDLEVQYAETPDLVLGVRLAIGDQTVEWSVRRYLDRLENAMTETLKAGGPVPEAAQQTEGADTA